MDGEPTLIDKPCPDQHFVFPEVYFVHIHMCVDVRDLTPRPGRRARHHQCPIRSHPQIRQRIHHVGDSGRAASDPGRRVRQRRQGAQARRQDVQGPR